MAAALTLLLIGSLLQGALCGEFKASMPQTIEVLNGSCVTIPCSFDIPDSFESNLDSTCKAVWKNDQRTVFDSSNPQQTTVNGELTGDLMRKDCTTTLHSIQPAHSNTYLFRVQCDNALKYTFFQQIPISVKADPPRPTLTPSTLKVEEGTSVNLMCSAPAPCLAHPPSLTWTPGLGDSQETLRDNQDQTKVKTSVVNFTASHHHHGKTISCTAVYSKQDGSTESAVSSTLTAHISFSPKHTRVSVHPSGPVPEDSNVTLTCSSTANPAVRNYTWYRADGGQETVVGTGHVLTIKASKDDRLLFCQAENDVGAGRSINRHIDVQFAPQILPSSDCTKAASQLSCSCRIVGNPSPTLQWYLDGLPVNHSDKFLISKEPLNDTGLRSVITVNQPQERDLSTLLCHSSNYLGSASQRYCVSSLEPQTSAQSQDRVTLPVFIITVVALLVLVCALLFGIRAQKTHCNLPQSRCTGDSSTVPMSQPLTSGEGDEVPNTTEEDIYVNLNTLRRADGVQPAASSEPNSTDLPSAGPSNAEEDGKRSEKKKEEGNDVIYTTVNWKSKSMKKKGEVDMHQPVKAYLEEERCMVGSTCTGLGSTSEMVTLDDKVKPGNREEEVESEYTQVHFKDKSAMHK